MTMLRVNLRRNWSILLPILVALVIGCGDSPTSPSQQEYDLSLTPMADEEAETAAYFLSGDVMASLWLYNKIRTELEMIRREWSDSIPQVNIKYRPYAHTSCLYAGFEPSTFDSIAAGTYHSWDSLNQYYRLDSAKQAPYYRLVILHFHGRLNPIRLVDVYKGLPGMRYTHTSSSPGDRSVLLLILEGRDIKYFFREAYGDCPAGCAISDFYYFTIEDKAPLFQGSWRNWPRDSIPEPIWYDTVWQAFHDYLQFNSWRRDTIPPVYTCDTLQIDVPEVHQWDGNKEAKYTALYLSGEFNPPHDLYERILSDLAWIRQQRPDSVSAVDTIRYRRGFHPGSFLAQLDVAEIEDSSSESYWLFRCLNEYFDFYVQAGNSWWNFHHGGIGPIVHPKQIIESYTVVPAITYMKAAMDSDVMPDIYTYEVSDTIKYFFREVWGSFVPWEWEYQRYHFFETTTINKHYIGSYILGDNNPPAWLELALQAREDKYTPYVWIR